MSNFETFGVIVEGLSGTAPSMFTCSTADSLATITAAGYLDDKGDKVKAGDQFIINYADVSVQPLGGITGGQSATFGLFYAAVVSSHMNLVLQYGNGSSQSVFTDTTSSATPGTLRALMGKMTGTATTMTSGNLVGVRGELDVVGASAGFLYGAQGKVIATGTLSGSSWTAAMFGQFDISAATVNAGQTACIWGDYGTTSGTITDASGMRGIAMTNTTAAVLNAQDYRYGNATYLLELAGAGGTLNYYAAAGTSGGSAGDASHCAAQKVLKIEINGVAAYIPVFTQNS